MTQPGGGVALDQQASRVTQLSCSGGMLWAGALMGLGFQRFSWFIKEGVALDQLGLRITQLPCSGGMLWASAQAPGARLVPTNAIRTGLYRRCHICEAAALLVLGHWQACESKMCQLNAHVTPGAAAATTAVLINRQGTPLNGAIYWVIQAGFGGGKYAAKIASQGCAL